VLQAQFAYLSSKSNAAKQGGKGASSEDFIGEYQTIMDQEFFDFILYEIPWVIT